MNNIEIENILKVTRYVKDIFMGVFSVDTLPRHVKLYPSCYIVNTDESTDSGECWVCVYFNSNGIADFSVVLVIIHTFMITKWFHSWKEIVIYGNVTAKDYKVVYQLYVGNTVYFLLYVKHSMYIWINCIVYFLIIIK